MSYCRFSSDDFASDIYAYPSEQGYEIFIASMRYGGDIPKLRLGNDVTPAEMEASYRAQIAFLKQAEQTQIDLPLAGGTISCSTLEEFKERMQYLRELGYNFPDAVFLRIDAELEAQELEAKQ